LDSAVLTCSAVNPLYILDCNFATTIVHAYLLI